MACLGITGAMRTAPTAAMEVLLGLPPLHLQMDVEARIGNYRLRCNEQWKPKSEGFGHTYLTRDMESEPILQVWSDEMTPRHVYEKPFIIMFPDRSESNKGFQPNKKGGLIWYTDGSKTEKALGLWCTGQGLGEQKAYQTMGILNRTQKGKGTNTGTLCQKTERSAEAQ
jgi:hypothetical protein